MRALNYFLNSPNQDMNNRIFLPFFSNYSVMFVEPRTFYELRGKISAR